MTRVLLRKQASVTGDHRGSQRVKLKYNVYKVFFGYKIFNEKYDKFCCYNNMLILIWMKMKMIVTL